MANPLGFGDLAKQMSGNTAFSQATMAQFKAIQDGVIPKITTAVRDALTSVPEGLLIYNTTTHKYNFRAAAAWEAITSA